MDGVHAHRKPKPVPGKKSPGHLGSFFKKVISKATGLVEYFRKPRRRKVHPALQAQFDMRDASPNRIRRTLFGHSKRYVVEVMGPPVAAMASAAGPDAVTIYSHSPQTPTQIEIPSVQDFWMSDIWYYPVNDSTHQAIAVIFQGDRVTRMQFLNETNWKK